MWELGKVEEDAFQLRQLVVSSEARELATQQKMQSTEFNLDEVERLRAEVDKLMLSLRTYEASEDQVAQAREDQEAARQEVEVLKLDFVHEMKSCSNRKPCLKLNSKISALKQKIGSTGIKPRMIEDLRKISSIPHSPHPVPAS